jgi:hypothetical protein
MFGNMLVGCVEQVNETDEGWEILIKVPSVKGLPAAKSVTFINGMLLGLRTPSKPQLVTPSKVLVDLHGRPLLPTKKRT